MVEQVFPLLCLGQVCVGAPPIIYGRREREREKSPSIKQPVPRIQGRPFPRGREGASPSPSSPESREAKE